MKWAITFLAACSAFAGLSTQAAAQSVTTNSVRTDPPAQSAEKLFSTLAGNFREVEISETFNSITYYDRPGAHRPGLCQVSVLTFGVFLDEGASDVRAYGISQEARYKFVGRLSGRWDDSAEYKAAVAPTEAVCSQLKTAKDFFRQDPVGNLYSATLFLQQAIDAARGGEPLGFALACDELQSDDVTCAPGARQVLAKLDATKVGRADRCSKAEGGFIPGCHRLIYDPPPTANGGSGWIIEVRSAESGNSVRLIETPRVIE